MDLTPSELTAIVERWRLPKVKALLPNHDLPASVDVLTLALALQSAYHELDAAQAQVQSLWAAMQPLIALTIPDRPATHMTVPVRPIRWLHMVARGDSFHRAPLLWLLRAAYAVTDATDVEAEGRALRELKARVMQWRGYQLPIEFRDYGPDEPAEDA